MQCHVTEHFQMLADGYDMWKVKNWYYYEMLKKLYESLVPPHRSVIEIGCGTGDILNSLRPSRGLGIDVSQKMVNIARRKHPGLKFLEMDAQDIQLNEGFEFVIMPDLIEHISDIQAVLEGIKRISMANSKVIISTLNPLWVPVVTIAEILKLKMPEGKHRWVWARELRRLLRMAGFVSEYYGYTLIIPKAIPWLSDFLNSNFCSIPLIRRLGMIYYVVGIKR